MTDSNPEDLSSIHRINHFLEDPSEALKEMTKMFEAVVKENQARAEEEKFSPRKLSEECERRKAMAEWVQMVVYLDEFEFYPVESIEILEEMSVVGVSAELILARVTDERGNTKTVAVPDTTQVVFCDHRDYLQEKRRREADCP